MKTIHQEYTVRAPVKGVWQALVDPTIIDQWGGGPATMSDAVDTEFTLWGGDIHGKNIEVILEKKLVQEWFGGDWPEASHVTFTLSEKDSVTTVVLDHTDVPDNELDDISDGWKEYYFGPMKKLLEK